MAGKKRILVACGTAIATSTVVARKIEEELSKRGIPVETTQCKASEVTSRIEGHDLVVTTTFVSGTGDIPVIHTVSFLTGVGIEKDIDRIVEYLGSGR
jgi:galactitol PTS system EIIB component